MTVGEIAGLVAAIAFVFLVGMCAIPLVKLGRVLDELATAHGDKITFLKMNVDENPVTPSSYRVTGIPTINVYQGGEVVRTIVGARPKAALLKELEEFTA